MIFAIATQFLKGKRNISITFVKPCILVHPSPITNQQANLDRFVNFHTEYCCCKQSVTM